MNTSIFRRISWLLLAGGLSTTVSAVDHNCRIGQPNPMAIILEKCEGPKDKDLTAPITCEGVPRGTATGHFDASKAVKHNGRYQPQFVVFTGDCGHETITESKQIRILYPGENGDNLGSVHWTADLGRVAGNKSGGALCFDAESLSPGVVRPEHLTLASQGLSDVVWSPLGTQVHQILGSECFVRIEELAPTSFRVDYFQPDQIRNDTIETNVWYAVPTTSGWKETRLPPHPDSFPTWPRVLKSQGYALKTGAEPYLSYVFCAVGSSGLSIRTERPDLEPRTTTYLQNGSTWTKDESGLRSQTFEASVSGDRKTLTWTTSSPAGGAFVHQETFWLVDDRELLIESVDDPGGLHRATTYEYDLSLPAYCRYKPTKTIDPDGAWKMYEYDAEGRTISIRSIWLSGGESDVHRTVNYEYSPFLPTTDLNPGTPVDDGRTDVDTPRVETELIDGVPVRKTLRNIALDTFGYRIIREVRLLNPSATNLIVAWRDPSNPRSMTIYMPDSDYKPCSRLPMLVVNEDGTATHYDYGSGTYQPGDDGLPGLFTETAGGSFFRTIATHGTRESFALDELGNSATSYAGIPLRTTRDVKIETRIGKYEALRETHVCNDSGGYERIAWTTTTRNNQNQIVSTRSSDGTRSEQGWNGTLLAWERNSEGIRTDFTYDELGRKTAESHIDPLTSVEVVTSATYDAEDHTLTSTTTAGTLVQTATTQYDAVGRIVSSRGTDGILTTFAYGATNGLSYSIATHGADTDIATTTAIYSFLDGQIAYTERNGHRAETYRYGFSNGMMWTLRNDGPKCELSPIWHLSVSDALGRTIRDCSPGFGSNVLITCSTFLPSGHLTDRVGIVAFGDGQNIESHLSLLLETACGNFETNAVSIAHKYIYDDLGREVVFATDVNKNSTIDFAVDDVVTSNSTSFISLNGSWWVLNQIYSFPSNETPVLTKTNLKQISGFGDSFETATGVFHHISTTIEIDENGNEIKSREFLNSNSHVRMSQREVPWSSIDQVSYSSRDLLFFYRSEKGEETSYRYDPLGRKTKIQDALGRETEFAYDDKGLPVWEKRPDGVQLDFTFDEVGRLLAISNNTDCLLARTYSSEGLILFERGAKYPVRYDYDEYGRQVSMFTYQDANSDWGVETKWFFDEATGLLTNKVFADGKGVGLSYTAEGLLKTRKWARGVSTDYTYDSRLELTSIHYSDETPHVEISRDRIGRIVTLVSSNVSTNHYEYTADGLISTDSQNGYILKYGYDVLGRRTSFDLGNSTVSKFAVSYSYDNVGRVSEISDQNHSFSYSYVPGQTLVSHLYNSLGYDTSWNYDSSHDSPSLICNQFQNHIISSFAYQFDISGNIVSRNSSGLVDGLYVLDRYSYNDRAELTSARRQYLESINSVPQGSLEYEYSYDDSGNRLGHAMSIGGEHLVTQYSVNELNQYTEVTNPNRIAIQGQCSSSAYVTINGMSASTVATTSTSRVWSCLIPTATNCPALLPVVATAVEQGVSEAADVVQDQSGSIQTKADVSSFQYDEDGNLLFDGRHFFQWDAENRMTSAVDSLTGRSIFFRYSPTGKVILQINVDSSGTTNTVKHFWWDAEGIVFSQEFCDDSVTENAYLWGNDMRGSLSFGGGVGGLLAVISDDSYFIPLYDGSGNVIQYADEEGNVLAMHDYDPFGCIIRKSESQKFLHWFSTQPYIEELNVCKFRYRDYAPELGRWLSRDPMGEVDVSLYAYVQNSPISTFDPLGLWKVRFDLNRERKISDRWSFQLAATGFIGVDTGRLNFSGSLVWKEHLTRFVPNPLLGMLLDSLFEKMHIRQELGAQGSVEGILFCSCSAPSQQIECRIVKLEAGIKGFVNIGYDERYTKAFVSGDIGGVWNALTGQVSIAGNIRFQFKQRFLGPGSAGMCPWGGICCILVLSEGSTLVPLLFLVRNHAPVPLTNLMRLHIWNPFYGSPRKETRALSENS